MKFPLYLSPRWPLAIWNALFTGSTGFTARPAEGCAVESWRLSGRRPRPLRRMPHAARLGHAGEIAGRRQDSGFLSGANLDGWYAPSLRQNLADRAGRLVSGRYRAVPQDRAATEHGSAYGSMRDVINNSTPYLTDDDLNSIAVYLKSLPASAEEPAYAYDGTTATALLSGRDDARGAATLCQQLPVLPPRDRRRCTTLRARTGGKSDSAGHGSGLADQHRAEWLRPAGRQGTARTPTGCRNSASS